MYFILRLFLCKQGLTLSLPAGDPIPSSVFMQSLISFQVFLYFLIHFHLSTLLDTLVFVRSNPSFPSWLLSPSAPPPSIFVFCLLSLLQLLFFLLCASFSFTLYLSSILSFLYRSLLCLLFSTVTSHPLFSWCLSVSAPFSLFAALFPFTLGVSALWRLSAPSWTSRRRKSWKANCQTEKGRTEIKENKLGEKGKMEVVYMKKIYQFNNNKIVSRTMIRGLKLYDIYFMIFWWRFHIDCLWQR